MIEGISFSATLAGVRTTVDGGWRLILDVPQSEAQALLELFKLRDQVLGVGVVTEPKQKKKTFDRVDYGQA